MTTAVRTGGPGRDGISVLVIPTNTKGFKARKIKNSGVNAGGNETKSSFDLVYVVRCTESLSAASAWIDLENVVVPVENLIGIENQGFPVLMSSKLSNSYSYDLGA
jgi:alkylation response protein AidB-like acyl-CoA dehydrogenase